MTGSSDSIEFSVLLRSPATDAGLDASAATAESLENYYPAPDAIESCGRWLAGAGVTCHPTNFGLACSAPRKLLEELFSTRLEISESATGPKYKFAVDPTIPAPIAGTVHRITIEAAPEFF